MKKIIAVLLVCLMAFGVYHAVEETKHTHITDAQWERNAYQHWNGCECGAMLNVGTHTMENDRCVVCGSKIQIFDDGMADIRNYNEYGEMTRKTMLDSKGSVIAEYSYVYRYDEKGSKVHFQAYQAGRLSEEIRYAQDFGGEYIVKSHTVYQDKTVNTKTYDGCGNLVNTVVRSPEGKLYFEENILYTYDRNLKVIAGEAHGFNVNGTEYIRHTNEYGDITRETIYGDDGNVSMEYIMEYEYDADGDMIQKKTYSNGVLESEWYLLGSQDSGNAYAESYVHEADGTTMFYRDNEYGDSVMTIEYDAEGRVIEEEVCEYEYAENGEILRERVYKNKVLTYEYIYFLDDSEEHYAYYRQQFIKYLAGGRRAVYEYGANGNFKGMNVFDASGEITARYDSSGKPIE